MVGLLVNFSPGIHSWYPEDESYWLPSSSHFSSSDTMKMTVVAQSEKSQQLLNGLPRNLWLIFKVPSGYIVRTLVILWLFLWCHQKLKTSLVIYVNICLMDWPKIWYRYSWFPSDVFWRVWWTFDVSCSTIVRLTFDFFIGMSRQLLEQSLWTSVLRHRGGLPIGLFGLKWF